MFCWSCISVYSVMNTNLMHYLSPVCFLQSTSTSFGHIFSPSSGGTLYIHNTYQLLCIYSIPPDDGPQICPRHVGVDWRNKLKKNSASSWFSLHGHLCGFYIDAEIWKIWQWGEEFFVLIPQSHDKFPVRFNCNLLLTVDL